MEKIGAGGIIYLKGGGEMKYTLVRSNRKTVSMEITAELEVLVRAPMRMRKGDIERFVLEHKAWAEEHIARRRERMKKYPEPDMEKKKELRRQAKEVIPAMADKYAGIMGVAYTGIKITGAEKRFGSCSEKNSLCFSYRLMMYPVEAIEYVVVHELAHIKHKNHSRDFYAFIESVMPDYKTRQKLLRS